MLTGSKRGIESNEIFKKDTEADKVMNKQQKDNFFKLLVEDIDYLSFKVASPTSAKIIAIIQYRITIVDSAHPFFSKWWWIGAILKILFPVSL